MANGPFGSAIVMFASAIWMAVVAAGPAAAQEASPAYLEIVRAYADAMVEHGRDVYGEQHSPLFAEVLDRTTMRMPEGEALVEVSRAIRTLNVRPQDRMVGGANPQHCENLYQVLYALTEITGEKRYANAADESLRFFFETCQSPATGLLCWGEHSGWDLRTDERIQTRDGDIHEFARPWVLWERSWTLAPEACQRFALGLWEHQIGDHTTGDFSRHARISGHGPTTEACFARHGGFYIETWATAYEKTQDPVFLQAIETVLAGLEKARLNEGGYVVSHTPAGKARVPFDASLAISLELAAAKVPATLAAAMRAAAAGNDEAFSRAKNPRPPGVGWRLWASGYGSGSAPASWTAFMLRYRQTRLDAYRGAVMLAAEAYAKARNEHDFTVFNQPYPCPIWPGTSGSAVMLMLDAHELTGEDRFLEAADHFARSAVGEFVTDCPLPKASNRCAHYEAITNGDTLMMALLKLWLVRNRPDAKIELIDTDR